MISELAVVQAKPGMPLKAGGEELSFYRGPGKVYLTSKRIFDLVSSGLMVLLIMSWLVPILAVLIKVGSRGPVFFRQKRMGKGGKVFTCYKFRTMHLNPEADFRQAAENDERITGIGAFLRKSNLDELPQLFNVLAGDMSLVGPRPHMLTDVQRFSDLIEGYAFRTRVRPGITGLAQVKGFFGPSADLHSIYGRYLHDVYYVRNACFTLDIQTLWITFGQRVRFLISFFDKNATGAGEK